MILEIFVNLRYNTNNENKNNKDKQINLLAVIGIFIIGVLIATNMFTFIYIDNINNQLLEINKEIKNLQADDVALAQTINNLYSQLEAFGVINK